MLLCFFWPSNAWIEDGQRPRDRSSDLLPGLYEGGFKLWECAVDLAAFVAALPPRALGP